MIRLTVATLAALYAILYVFGDDARRPAEAVSRAESPALDLSLTSYLPDLPDEATVARGRVSDREAVRAALEAGQIARAERKDRPMHGAVDPAKVDAMQAPAVPADTWYVTGQRVNLREGPGTSNPVVTQVTYGMPAEVLDDRDGWYRIRLTDGSASGWISGKFLDDRKPG